MSLISARDLSVGYESRAVAAGLSFDVNEGDYLCIVGENGAGKSTLMKTVLRLQKPVGGELIFDERLKKTGIGYLPQQTVIQKDFPASVMEIVLSGCQGRKGLRPFYNKADRELAGNRLAEMGISGLRSKCYSELSGGQQQRVLLARALCAADSILLLDEPAAGLDPEATEEMYRTIAKLHDAGMTVIMITHDMDAAVKYASHILMLGAGAFFGDRRQFLGSSEGRLYLQRGGRKDA